MLQLSLVWFELTLLSFTKDVMQVQNSPFILATDKMIQSVLSVSA